MRCSTTLCHRSTRRLGHGLGFCAACGSLIPEALADHLRRLERALFAADASQRRDARRALRHARIQTGATVRRISLEARLHTLVVQHWNARRLVVEASPASLRAVFEWNDLRVTALYPGPTVEALERLLSELSLCASLDAGGPEPHTTGWLKRLEHALRQHPSFDVKRVDAA